MAPRTTQDLAGLPRLLGRASVDDSPRRNLSATRSYAPLAVVVGCLTVLLLMAGSFWCGRMIEQRSQLGKLLAAAPALEELQSAIQQADSLGMQMMLHMGQIRSKTGSPVDAAPRRR